MILYGADEAGDSTLESRTCTPQNWRADDAASAKVGVGVEIAVAPICRGDVVDEAYGKATSNRLNSADLSANDGVGDLDYTAFYAAFSNGDPEADLNLDDAIDNLDITAWNAIFQSGVTKEPGASALSGLLVGYAGYMRDGFDDDLYHVRHRVYDTELGRWTRRDPLGYVDGMSVYEYVISQPISLADPNGLSPKKGPKTKDSDNSDQHHRYGAYYDIVFVCPDNQTTHLKGWARPDAILELMRAANKRGCCIRSMNISTHYNEDQRQIYARCDQSDAISESAFVGTVSLCDGAIVDLNMCNSCDIAKKIKEKHPNIKFKIECTDGENADDPEWGIDWTWFWRDCEVHSDE